MPWRGLRCYLFFSVVSIPILSAAFDERDMDKKPVDKRRGPRKNWKELIDPAIIGSHRRPIIYSDECFGYMTGWSKCSAQCWTQKRFESLKNISCPPESRKIRKRSVKVCTGRDCPLTLEDRNPFLKSLRTSMLLFEFHSQRVRCLTTFITSMQLPMQVMMALSICIVACARHLQVNWLPDVMVAVPVAAVAAITARYAGFDGVNFAPVMISSFGSAISSIMNGILLPITIFTGAYTVQRKNLFSEFPSALVLAVFGTASQIVLVGLMVKYSGELGWHCVDNWRESFAYASFIADVDPVTTLSIFANLKVPPLLQTLAAGEGLLNDPIALVIFGYINRPSQVIELDLKSMCMHIGQELCLSILAGTIVGLVLVRMMSWFKVPGKGSLESIYVVASAYFSFSFGESVHLSGIIVCLFAGLIMGTFVKKMVKEQDEIRSFLHVAAHYAELCMFFIVGLGVFLFDYVEDLALGGLTVLMCIIARGVTITVIVCILNVFRCLGGKQKIDFGTSFMLFHSNLRGGITVMMALQLNPSWSIHQDHILGSTIISMMGLNYLGGFTGPFFMEFVGLPLGVPQIDGDLWEPGTQGALFMHRIRAPLLRLLGRPAEISHALTSWVSGSSSVQLKKRQKQNIDSEPCDASSHDHEVGPPKLEQVNSLEIARSTSSTLVASQASTLHRDRRKQMDDRMRPPPAFGTDDL